MGRLIECEGRTGRFAGGMSEDPFEEGMDILLRRCFRLRVQSAAARRLEGRLLRFWVGVSSVLFSMVSETFSRGGGWACGALGMSASPWHGLERAK